MSLPKYGLKVGAALALLGLLAPAQDRETFKARLSSLPVDAKSRPNLVGSGTVTAVLTGRVCLITGSFEGLRGKATTASLHDGPL